MCGICGTVAMRGDLDPAVRAAIVPMTETLAHRGPDGEGIFTTSFAALGHRRLSIIDRAGGAQPMTNEDRTAWIAFNGEIYNHRALRRVLEGHGHRFMTTSDTEVIVHAYDEWGAGCVERLEGMFAFAVVDTARRELLLARDRVGKKPLFYAELDGILHFASEVKALRRSPAWDGALDLTELEGYLSLGYFLAPRTIYRHVQQLLPGHMLRLRNGQIEVSCYWDVYEFDTDRRPEASIVRTLESTIHSTVVERLESEVPLGAFLSGGIDSGLVVSFMSAATQERVMTTTVGFGGSDRDEVAAAAQTARRHRTAHHCEMVRPELEAVLDRIVGTLDQPFADGSVIPTYYVSAAARRHVTVALSGDGGDEAFGGYSTRYIPHRVEARLRGALGAWPRRVAAWVGREWPRSRRLPRWMRAGTVLENLARDDAAAYYADLCFARPYEARALVGLDPDRDPRTSVVYEQVTAPYRACPSRDAAQKAQYADLKTYLPNAVLVKVDRMSMLHGLEVRAPLLDRRVVEAAFRIPARVKLRGFQSKHLLRRLAAERLPASVVHRRKHGFDAPIGEWIAGRYLEQFRADVFGHHSIVPMVMDPRVVARLLKEHCARQVDHAFALWAIWVLARWWALCGRVAPPARAGGGIIRA